jgi:S1-C subfamily serine protease
MDVMIEGVKRLLSIATIGFSLVTCFDLFAASKPEKIYRAVLPAVMTLEVENFAGERFVGSAVLGLMDDVAITAWHVVSDARTVWASFADGTKIRVKGCIDSDGERDLALLKLEKPLPGRKVAFSYNLEAVATRAFVIGAPKGYGFSISDGLVSQIREVDGVAQYQVSCPISPGASGGPVLNARGQVIGITSWTKSDAQNLSFAIPSRELERLDPKAPVIPWETLALSARPPVAPRAASTKVTAKSESKQVPGFEDFTRRLERSTGKRVTVVVLEDGKENKYTFIVPPSLK